MRLAALLAGLAVLAADQLSKALIRSLMTEGEVRQIAGPLDLVSVRNDGVAFGALGGSHPWLLVLVAVVILAVLVTVVRGSESRAVWIAAGAIAGGAAGNVIDRVAWGAVTDFIKVASWPAFNLADVAIVCGAIGLVWFAERSDHADA